jgi:hypothetical protein
MRGTDLKLNRHNAASENRGFAAEYVQWGRVE